MMKKNYIHIYLLGLLLLSVACTGKFREFNTDQTGITDEDLIIDDNGYGVWYADNTKPGLYCEM